MFNRSEILFNVRYGNYVDDGNSKIYKDIVDSNPYEDLDVKKNIKIIGV